LDGPLVQNEVREFAQIYSREKGFYKLQIVDHQFNEIAQQEARVAQKSGQQPSHEKDHPDRGVECRHGKNLGPFYQPIIKR